jgi:hypothetical protein
MDIRWLTLEKPNIWIILRHNGIDQVIKKKINIGIILEGQFMVSDIRHSLIKLQGS